MEQHVLIGAILIASGLAELPVGFVMSSKMPPQKRTLVLGMLGMSGLAMVALGVAFIMKLIPLGS